MDILRKSENFPIWVEINAPKKNSNGDILTDSGAIGIGGLQ